MVVLGGCNEQQENEEVSLPDPAKTESQEATLLGSWQIIEFPSVDDAIGIMKPEDPSKYIMQFKSDGSVTMQLNCNRAMARWVAIPGQDSTSGRLNFGEIAKTRA